MGRRPCRKIRKRKRRIQNRARGIKINRVQDKKRITRKIKKRTTIQGRLQDILGLRWVIKQKIRWMSE